MAILRAISKSRFPMDSAVSPGSSEPPESDRKEQDVRDGSVEGSEEAKGVMVVDLKKGNPSWVSVAQDKRSLKKYEVEITPTNGKHKVVIPEDILSDSTPLWEDFVVGKFLDIAPHIAKVHMVVNKIWSYGEAKAKIEVYDVNANTMRFKITSQKAREKVIKRGMWNIAGVPMVVKKWTPKTEEEKQEEEAIPMWFHLRKVPLHMFSWEALSFMTSAVGFPVRLHPETIACSNFEEAKVFVNVDVSKSLPKEIDFTLEGKEFTAEFYYPWLPSRCNCCEKWGHTEKVCVMKKRGKQQGECEVREGNINIGGAGGSVEKVGEKDDESQNREGRTLRRKSIETSENKVVKEDTTSKEDNSNTWALVSPDKIGRVQSTPQREPGGVQISASKYSC